LSGTSRCSIGAAQLLPAGMTAAAPAAVHVDHCSQQRHQQAMSLDSSACNSSSSSSRLPIPGWCSWMAQLIFPLCDVHRICWAACECCIGVCADQQCLVAGAGYVVSPDALDVLTQDHDASAGTMSSLSLCICGRPTSRGAVALCDGVVAHGFRCCRCSSSISSSSC
jgi:hypothetical protein